MELELKIKLTDPEAIDNKIQSLGAAVTGETEFTDTYFNQPEGEVFKVTDTRDGFYLIQFKRTPEGRFQYTKNNKIENANEVIAEMTGEYGVKCVLTGKRKLFSLGDLKITINHINERGNFLILTGENPTEDFITGKLGIQNPEYITQSFDELTPTTSAAQSPAQSQ